MEVEIAALYITMHITLQWTGRPRVWSWRYGFKYGYWLICTLFHNCHQFQDIHLFCFLLLLSFPLSFQSSSPNPECLRVERILWDPTSQQTPSNGKHSVWSTYSHHRYLQSHPKVKRESESVTLCTQKQKITNVLKKKKMKILRHLHHQPLVNHLHLPWYASSEIVTQCQIMFSSNDSITILQVKGVNDIFKM